jgi:hypothetical protein
LRTCRLARCEVDLDAAGLKATALFCGAAHKAEWHRLRKAGEVSPQASSSFWRRLGTDVAPRSRPASRAGDPVR